VGTRNRKTAIGADIHKQPTGEQKLPKANAPKEEKKPRKNGRGKKAKTADVPKIKHEGIDKTEGKYKKALERGEKSKK